MVARRNRLVISLVVFAICASWTIIVLDLNSSFNWF